MKPGTKVALVVPDASVAILGTLNQPILFDDKRRWSVDWDDGLKEPDWLTWPEEWLLQVIPHG